jgi:hypothetical protein
MAPSRALLAVALALTAAAAQSKTLFVCTDAQGRTISADRPPPECLDRPIRELRPDGSVRRVIDPPPTPEQRAARAAEERRKQEEAEARRETMRRDLALLEAYASEQEIEETRQRALSSRMVIVERAQRRIEEHQRDRKKLDSEAEFYAARELPEKLKRSYQLNDSLVRSEQKIMADARADMDRVNERFDADVKRFRDLVQSGMRAPSR